MAATLSVGGFVHRSCGQHGSYAVRAGAPAGCPSCRENARKRGYEAARRAKAGLVCDSCGTTLLRPARLCGFCMGPEFDVDAALRALDHELAPGRSTAPEATTHEENPT
jgi:hypothetical protein